jgi:trigger factor
MIDVLRKQKMDWCEVESAAADGNRISIDFVGTVDGEKFDGGSANDMPMTIGAGQMIPGFEEKLVGLKVADETTFKVPFPDDYAAKNLAGKEAEFSVTIKKVEEAKLPEVDEDFVKAFGVESGDVAHLKIDIKKNMERELAKRLSMTLKQNVMDGLLNSNQLEVPSTIVMQEAEALKRQAEVQTPGSTMTVESFLDEARRRVQLGMIYTEVSKLSALNIDPEMVKSRIEELSLDYDDPDEFVRHYMGNQELLRDVQTLVMEDMVLDWVVQQAKITSASSNFDDVMNSEAK